MQKSFYYVEERFGWRSAGRDVAHGSVTGLGVPIALFAEQLRGSVGKFRGGARESLYITCDKINTLPGR